MRMWCIPTNIMCTKHIMQEHKDIHMIVGAINKKINIQSFILNGYIDTDKIKSRHFELAKEIEKRGGKHISKLPVFSIKRLSYLNKFANLDYLKANCKKCKLRIEYIERKLSIGVVQYAT